MPSMPSMLSMLSRRSHAPMVGTGAPAPGSQLTSLPAVQHVCICWLERLAQAPQALMMHEWGLRCWLKQYWHLNSYVRTAGAGYVVCMTGLLLPPMQRVA